MSRFCLANYEKAEKESPVVLLLKLYFLVE